MQLSQQENVTTVMFDVTPGWELWTFWTSDNHYDSVTCNRDLLTADLDQAKKRNALIFVVGDFFDAMQGRFDPRRSMDELREEYRRNDYYDYVVRDAAKFLNPYANNLAMMGMGNHEASVVKNANTNLLDRTVEKLNDVNGTAIQRGGYGGWVRFMFNMSGGENTGPRTSVKVKYFHGSGGEAPVTRGAIQTNRQAVYLPDANLVINGHSHNGYHIPITRERMSGKGKLYFDTQHHLRIPGYKQAYGDGSGGWEVERGGVPKPLGSWWVKLYCEQGQIKIQPVSQFSDPVPVSPAYSYDEIPEPYSEDNEYP